ncbi:2-hydroxyacid dehydrogenase [Massilia sp. S19_KUP03_FR1]|uniref:2-hydroxyacid dehydrogenase n=1 Tax=Massilia sp. S19_KUP03_FR1 TaxID=3025503 RepID=UPI002FCD409B
MKIDLLQVGAYAPAHQAQLDAEFSSHSLEAVEADPALAGRIRGLVTRSNVTLAADVLARLPQLEIVATFGVGYDGLPLAAAAARGIAVTNTPEVLNTAVAELCVGMLLGLMRRLPAADRFVRDGQWMNGTMALGTSLSGKRVGVVGLGRIGKDIARRLEPFGVSLAYHGRSDQHLAWRYEPDLVRLAQDSDVLIVAAPGGPATRKLIDRAVLDALGPQGVLVNIARGSLVDQAALIEALEQKTLGGAALDVFEQEPCADVRLAALENVLLAPHLGSATVETRQAMMDLVLDNLRCHFAGQALPTPVIMEG